MITENKFLKLKKITQLKKIALEIEKIRNSVLSGEIQISKELETYFAYITNIKEYYYYRKELAKLFKENNLQKALEKSHFLYHKIMDDIGYPLSENQFIKREGDGKNIVKKTDLIIILENLRSAFNVGSILRISDGFGVKKIYATGLTPDNIHPQVLKTAKDSEKYVNFQKIDNIKNCILNLRDEGYKIIAVETVLNAKNISNYKFKSKTALVFGNEEIGLTAQALNLSDDIIEIKLHGFKNSLNVSSAASIAIYQYGEGISNL